MTNLRTPIGFRPGVLYGSGKIHKETRNGLPPFHPIPSAIDMPTYKLAKTLLKLLIPSTNEYIVIDSIHFAEEIFQQDFNIHMVSLDVGSLFTNIPLDETFDDTQNSPNILKHDFRNLLNIAIKESFFLFNNKYYKQVDGVAMGFPSVSIFFMWNFESIWLLDCPNDFKHVHYRRYVDNIFALFSSPDHADRFKEYLSFKHPNINFSIEKENDDCLPFLDDTNIDLQLTSIEKRLYRKVYTNFKSLIGLIILLLFRYLSLCSDFIKFYHEIDKLKSIFYRKSYPRVS